MATTQSFIAAVLSWIIAHQAILIPIALVILNDVWNGLSKYPLAQSIVGVLRDLLSTHVAKNSPGSTLFHTSGTFKLPFTRSLPPAVVGAQVSTQAPIAPIGAFLLFMVAMQLTACASISWSTPVIYAGPVGGVEEVSKANPTPAVAGGFQLSMGLGQFNFQGHQYDLLDPGVLALGGLVPGGSGPTGQLQLGGKLSTLAGIAGFGLLFDCVDSASQGVCQGGPGSGPIFAGLVDVQAIVAFIDQFSPPGSEKAIQRLPRGGL